MKQNLLPIFAIFMLCVALTPRTLIAQSAQNPYENVNSFQLFRTLEKPCRQYAQNVTVRSAVENLSNAYEVAIWVDRRVDADQIISISTNELDNVESVLSRISSESRCEIAYLNQIAYLAPKGEAEKIEFAYWRLFENQRGSEAPDPSPLWTWNKVTEPAEIIETRTNQLSLKPTNIDAIEHDLWAPYSLPASNFAAQWTCILAGFDLTLRTDAANEIKFEKLPASSKVQFRYTQQQMLTIGKERFNKWQSKWVGTNVKRVTTKDWEISGPVAAHRDFVRLANLDTINSLAKDSSDSRVKKTAPKKSPGSVLENSRFTLKVTGSLGSVLNAVKQQAALELQPWPIDRTLSSKQISLDLKQATIDELLQAIAKEADVEINRSGKEVTIRSKQN